MAREIVVTLDGVESGFGFKAIERSQLYGRRRRIALDRSGEPCSRASLLEDGSLLLKSGMTGQGYFLADGRFVKQSALEAFDESGQPLSKVTSTVGVAQPLVGPVNPGEVLDLRPSTVFALDEVNVDSRLAERLKAGEIFRFPFNFRDDFRAETGFLLGNDDGFFAVVGAPVEYEWVSFESVRAVNDVSENSDDDDLDFEMF